MNSTDRMKQEIFEICLRIKNKVEVLEASKSKVNLFNVKLEALLKTIEVFSIDPEPVKKISTCAVVDKKIVNKPQPAVKTQEEITCDELFKKENRKVKAVANDLLEYLKEQKTVFLDDLVKKAKLSKYKTISILGVFVKENLITKRFDKGFIYEINC